MTTAINEEKKGILHEVYEHLMNGINHMLPILAGYIAVSIADKPGLAAGLVGGTVAGALLLGILKKKKA